jgi:hypothetical protein
MNAIGLQELENRIAQLSRDEQLWLIERLAHRLRLAPSTADTTLEDDLAAMAADPDIQRELRAIEQEFAGTEGDGLENGG